MTAWRTAKVGDRLSRTQLELLRLMCAGLMHKEIAVRLHLARSSIAYHSLQLRQKTGCKTDAQLGVWAVRNGIVESNTSTEGQASPRLGAAVSPSDSPSSGQALRAVPERR